MLLIIKPGSKISSYCTFRALKAMVLKENQHNTSEALTIKLTWCIKLTKSNYEKWLITVHNIWSTFPIPFSEAQLFLVLAIRGSQRATTEEMKTTARSFKAGSKNGLVEKSEQFSFHATEITKQRGRNCSLWLLGVLLNIWKYIRNTYSREKYAIMNQETGCIQPLD